MHRSSLRRERAAVIHTSLLTKKSNASSTNIRHLHNTENVNLPVYPGGQSHSNVSNDVNRHVAPFKHGAESQAAGILISQREALKPSGQLQVNDGGPPPTPALILQVPPFWQRGLDSLWQGLRCWQNSPAYRDVQLEQKSIKLIVLKK